MLPFSAKIARFCLLAGAFALLYHETTERSFFHGTIQEKWTPRSFIAEEQVRAHLFYTQKNGLLSQKSFLSSGINRPYYSQLGFQGLVFSILYKAYAAVVRHDYVITELKPGDILTSYDGQKATVRNISVYTATQQRTNPLSFLRVEAEVEAVEPWRNAPVYVWSDGENQGKVYFMSMKDGKKGKDKKLTSIMVFRESMSTRLTTFIDAIQAILGALFVVMMLWIVMLIGREFGWFAGAFAYAGTVLSQWTTLMAQSTYWIVFWMFAPFILAWHYYERLETRSVKSRRIFLALLFLAFYLRCLGGLEFYSNIALSPLIPCIYFSLKANKKWLSIILECCRLFAAAVGAFCLALVTQVIVFGLLAMGLAESAAHLLGRATSRTLGKVKANSGVLDYLKSVYDLVVTYLNIPLIHIGSADSPLLVLSLKHFILILLAITLLVRLPRKMRPIWEKNRPLLITTLIALPFSLTWVILAKNHSTAHQHRVPLTFAIAFLPMFFATLGKLCGDYAHPFLLAPFTARFGLRGTPPDRSPATPSEPQASTATI